MIYLGMFSVTIALTYLYQYSMVNKQYRLIRYTLAFMIILIPSLLGGFRDIRVGTDNINYNQMFQICYHHDLRDLFSSSRNVARIASIEKGFIVLLWLLSRLGNEFYIFAFGTSLVTFTFIFLGMDYFKDRYSMPIMMAIYFFIYYCDLFNYVRQGIALSIVFFALRYVEGKQPIKYIIAVMIAMSFHTSAILAIAIYIIFYLKDKIHYSIYLVVVLISLMIFFIVGPQWIGKIVNNLIQGGLLVNRYTRYANLLTTTDSYTVGLNNMGRSLPQLVAFTITYRKIAKDDPTIKGYYIMSWVQFFVIMLGSVFPGFIRLALYFNISEIILFGAMIRYFRRTGMKWLAYPALAGYLLTYWILYTVMNYNGFHNPTYPYILGF